MRSGAILYELLTGRPPFKGETSLDTIQQVLHNEPVPPRRLNSRTPRDLEIICLKCLEKEPHRRYEGAQALAEDLSRFLADRPIVARPASQPDLAWRWCRKNPALAAASGLAVAALLGISIVSALFSVSASRDARQLSESATKLTETLRISEEHRLKSELRLAENYLERARALADQGSGAASMLLLARALQVAPQDEMGLQYAIRMHIGALRNRLHPPLSVLATSGALHALAMSPAGDTIAAGRTDGVIRLWSTRWGNEPKDLKAHAQIIRSLVFSPDGRVLMSASDDGTAGLWDLHSEPPVGRRLRHGGMLLTASFSPNGRKAVSGGARRLRQAMGRTNREARWPRDYA